MALTLGNNLTGTVSRTVVESNRKAATLGESMTTGLNQDTQAVDSFLGNSLRDSEKILSAVTKNINYSINMFGTASEYTNILAKSLQEGLTVIGSSGQVSAQKLATLEQGLKDVRAQAALLIKTASFDNKALLTGGVRNLSVQVGLSTVDKLTVGIDNIGEGRLFRSGATKLLIDYFAADVNRSRYYAANQQQLKEDRTDNKNLVIESLEATNPTQTLTDRQLATGLTAIRSKSKGAESTQVLSGVSKHFNERAKAQLIASWENIFKRDTIFAADANGDAAAHDAAEAIVVGMEQGLDFAQIRTNASEAAKTADNGDGGLDAVRDQARVIIDRYLNGGGVAENLGAAIDSHARLVNGTGAQLVGDLANPDYDITNLEGSCPLLNMIGSLLQQLMLLVLARAGNACSKWCSSCCLSLLLIVVLLMLPLLLADVLLLLILLLMLVMLLKMELLLELAASCCSMLLFLLLVITVGDVAAAAAGAGAVTHQILLMLSLLLPNTAGACYNCRRCFSCIRWC